MPSSFPFPLTRCDLLVGAAIVLLAFALRVVVIFDRAAHDPTFDPLPAGTDQRAYPLQAALWEAGEWPTEPFRYQPGMTYFLIGVRALIGRSLGQMALGLSLASALGCGFLTGAGWLLTRRRWGGYLAGLLLAVYPVTIFYATVTLTEGLALVYVCLFLFLALWWQLRPSLWLAAGVGLTLGLMTITRTNLAALGLAWAVLVWLTARGHNTGRVEGQGRTAVRPYGGGGANPVGASHDLPLRQHLRSMVVNVVVTLIFMGLVIAPVTLWNRQSAGGGAYPLVTSTGMVEVYRGNNRDATGIRSTEPAMRTADDGYEAALLADIRRDPLRFIELQLRKSGIYWSDSEPGNNADYLQHGEAASPLLRLIPLDFGLLALAGWLGVVVLGAKSEVLSAASEKVVQVSRRGEPAVRPYTASPDETLGVEYPPQPARHVLAVFLLLANLLIFGGVLLLWVEGRLKQPAVPPLVLSSAYLLVRAAEAIRGHEWHGLARRYALPALVLIVIYGGLIWARENLPAPHPVTGLPDDLRRLDVTFDDRLRLVGWRPLAEWPGAGRGWSNGGRSFTIELYWQALQPMDVDYQFYLAYLLDGERLYGADWPVGAVSYRPKPTSQWQAGEMYAEIFGFSTQFNAPSELSGEVRLGVYTRADDGGLIATPITEPPGAGESLLLTRLAMFNLSKIGQIPEGYEAAAVDFGGLIGLRGVQFPADAAPGETVHLGFFWTALAEINADYTLFVHVEDAAGTPVTQADSPPRGNTLVTSTWPPGYPVTDEIAVTLPETPGTYRLLIGWYHSITFDRLGVDAPDNRWPLGDITVR